VRCLQPAKEDRPANAGEFARAVSGYLASVEQRARDAELEATAERARASQERRAKRLTVVLATVLLLAGVGGLYVYLQRAAAVRENRREVHALLDTAEHHAQRKEFALALASLRQAEARMPAAQRSDVQKQAASYGALALIYAVRYEEEFEAAELDEAYGAAFAELGIDVLASEGAAVGDRIASDYGRMRVDLALALDDWASGVLQAGAESEQSRRATPETVAKWRKLVEAANRADTDEWRRALRTAALDEDGEALESLAAQVKTEAHPPESIVLLFHALQAGQKLTLAVEVLEAGAQHHPDDFWIHFLAARLTGGRTSRTVDWDSAVRHAAVAVALRPNNSDARAAYGFLLLRRAKARGGTGAAEARTHLERAVELNPENDRARWGLVGALIAGGNTAAAKKMAQELRAAEVPIPRGFARMLMTSGSKAGADRRRGRPGKRNR